MKIKKIACLLMALAMIGMTASCRINDPSITELTDPPGTQQSIPPDPGSDGPSKPEPPPSDPVPSKPVDPTVPSEPAPSVPVDPSTPSGTDDPAHEHEYVAVVTKATCIEVGYTTYTCDCGDVYVGDRIEATGHQWSDWVVTKEPTVDETGEAVSICAMCENTQSKVLGKVIPNHTHNYSEKVTKKATCSAEGVMTLTCSCGDQFTRAIAKTSHNFSKKEVWPTCYAQGYMTYTCRNCGYSYKGDYKNKVPCSFAWEDVPPTCTTDGYTIFMCDYCLQSYYENIIPATGHSYGDYKSNGDATCSKDGTKTSTCSACGDKITIPDVGSATAHDYSVTVVEPTMYDKGYTLLTCKICGHKFKDNYTELSTDARQQFIKEVEAATVKYINQFRQEQGDTVATVLPVLTQIAQDRAVQLQDNFRHDSAALRELYNQYKYGEWVDGSPWGGSQYYNGNAMEAIGKCSAQNTADEVGLTIAYNVRGSKGHWDYVGSSEYPYIAVGISFDPVKCTWYICILQTAKNNG